MEKTILLTLTYLVGLGELILAGFFWKTHSNNEIRKVMFLLSFSTGMWVVTSAITSYKDPSTITTFLLGLVYVFGALIMTSLLHFALVFPYRLIVFDKLHTILLYVPSLLFSIIALTTKAIVQSYTGSETDPGIIISGPLHDIYNNYLLILFLISLCIMLFRIPRLDGLHKRNVKIVFWSVLIGGTIPVIIDLILPTYFSVANINALYANLSTVIWLGGTTYIINKK